MRLTREDGTVIAEPLEVASTLLTRGLGLMGRSSLATGRGLLIEPCNGIHMMFMRFPIDAVFMDKRGRVVKVYEHLLPWIGLVPLVLRAHKVAELPAGTVRQHALKPGELLKVA